MASFKQNDDATAHHEEEGTRRDWKNLLPIVHKKNATSGREEEEHNPIIRKVPTIVLPHISSRYMQY
jgi:hypothetical protein